MCCFKLGFGVSPSCGMMWWRGRFWLILTVVLLVRNAQGHEDWRQKSVYYDVTPVSVAQPENSIYLPDQFDMGDSISSVSYMQSSSLFNRQDMEPNEDDLESMWDTRNAIHSSEDDTEGFSQSVIQSSRKSLATVFQSQLLGTPYGKMLTSENADELTPLQSSMGLLQKGHLHPGFSGNMDPLSTAHGFQSPYSSGWVHTASVQSAPTHEGGYMAQSADQSRYYPSGKPHVPSHPQPQRRPHLPHPDIRPVGQPPAFVPQAKVSLSYLANEGFTGNSGASANKEHTTSDQQRSSMKPYWTTSPWVASTWQTTNLQSEFPSRSQMVGSGVTSTRGQSDWIDENKLQSLYGHLDNQDVYRGKSPSQERAAQSHMWGTEETIHYPSSKDGAGRESHGHLYSKDAHRGGSHGQEQVGQEYLQHSGLSSTHHSSNWDDARKGQSHGGHWYLKDVHKGKSPGHQQTAQSDLGGSGVTSTHHHSGRDEARKRHGHWYSKEEYSDNFGSTAQTGQSRMRHSEVTTNHHSGRDEAKKRHGHDGHSPSQDMHRGGSHSHQHTGQSHMQGSEVTSTHHLSGRDEAKKHHGHSPSQDMHRGGSHSQEHAGKSHMQGSEVTSTHHLSGRDEAKKRHGHDGHSPSQDMHRGGSHSHEHNGQSHMQGSEVTAHHHSGRDEAKKRHGHDGHFPFQDMHRGGSHSQEHAGKSHMQGSEVTAHHHSGRDEAKKHHGHDGHSPSQDMHRGGSHSQEHAGQSHMQGSDPTSTHHHSGRDEAKKHHGHDGHSPSQNVHRGGSRRQ